MRNRKRGNGEWNGVTVSRGRAVIPERISLASLATLTYLKTVISAWCLYNGKAISSISL